MSKEISSTFDENKAQTDEENCSNNTPNHKTDNEKAPFQTRETEAIPKTPISSATTFNELHEKENKNPSVFVDESFEITEPTEGYNETECVKFAEKLHKIVEELRIGRVSDRENELRIQKLMSEKNDLERIKDDEASKNQELIKKHSIQQDESRKQFDDKLRSFQEDKTKYMLEKQSGEQEIKALKDEIRSLHINKYSMEKMIKDQERQIQNHGTSNTNYLTQLAKVENQCKDIFKQCSQVLATVDKVEANINSSTKLNKKLGFMNEHQKCILVTYREKYEKTKQDLISLQACKVSSCSAEGEDSNNEKSTVHLEDELRMQKELCQQVQVQLNDSREEIQGLLKSLDNAHSLLVNHVETNNKYAETETLLQVELDDLRTDCEKYKEDLKTEKASLQEKDVFIKELKNTMEEKEKHLSEQIEKVQKEKETLVREKTSLEELNSTWSQKIVEQKDEIESTKKRMSEMETSMEEGKQQLEAKSSEVETLEEKLKTEASRYENLLQKANEERLTNSNEANKWRERTTELLLSEEKLKAELDKIKRENKMKEPQNQCTQTKVFEKASKETNTDQLLIERSSITVDKGTIQDITFENHRSEDEIMTSSQSKDKIVQPKSDNTFQQPKPDNTPATDASADRQPSLEESEATKKRAKVNNIETQQSIISKEEIFNNLEQQNTGLTISSDEPQLPNYSTTFDNTRVNESTVNDQHPLETQNSKKQTLKNSPSKQHELILANTQKPTTVKTMTQPVSLLEEKNTMITPQQPNDAPGNITTNQNINPTPQRENTVVESRSKSGSNKSLLKQDNTSSKQATCISRNSPPQTITAATNIPTKTSKNPTLQNKNTDVGNKSIPNESLLKQSNISSPNQKRVSPSQNRVTPMSFSESNRQYPRQTDTILRSKPREKRTPLLAVVKPSSAGTLIESTSNDSTVTSRQPRKSETFNTTADNGLKPKGPAEAVHSRVPNPEPRKSESKTTSLNNLTNVNLTQNSDLASSFTSSQTRAKIIAEISIENSTDRQNSESIKSMKASVTTKFTSDEDIIKASTETRVSKPRTAKKSDPDQTLFSRKFLRENTSSSEKSDLTSSRQDESKKPRTSKTEDFCFSDEEDESIPRAIGSQVDRIETFLKNERLRLSKKRKVMDD